MGVGLILGILTAQVIVFTVIFCVLRTLLNKQLIEMAVRQVEHWPLEESPLNVSEILALSYKPLKPDYKARLTNAVVKHFGKHVKLEFKEDTVLLGGMILNLGQQTIDCSLKDRLTRALKKS